MRLMKSMPKTILTMKSTKPSQVTRGVKYPLYLVAALVIGASTWTQAQSLISSTDFFDPDYEARRPGGGIAVVVDVNTTLYTPGAQSDGDVTWNHSAGGLVQTRVLGLVDIQLAAYTETIGNSLVFGRELTTSLLGLDLLNAVPGLVSDVVGASAINSWATTSTVNNLTLNEGVLYSVQFDVSAGSGLNLSALSDANFSLLSGGLAIQDINTTTTLDVLSLLTLGGGTTSIDFQFYAPSGGADELTFAFDAATIANVSLLGGITGNQTVLEYSNFSVAPVPEPGSLALASLGVIFILRRRRPCGL